MVEARKLVVGLVAILVAAGCAKEKKQEDADADGDAVDMSTDTPDDDATPPDGEADVPEDGMGDPDAEADAPTDTPTEGDGPLPGDRILFSVAPGATGLAGTAVEAAASPESAVFETDTAQAIHSTGTNTLFIDPADLGLAVASDIDGLSVLEGIPPYRPTFWFSVEDLASHDEGAPTTGVRAQSDAAEVPGDVFSSACNRSNAIAFDDASLGLQPATPGGDPDDDLNALEIHAPATAAGLFYFSVKPGAVGLGTTAVATTASADLPGTIFVSALDGNNEVAFSRLALGLAPDDDVDALVVFGTAGVARYAHFSVTSSSQGLNGTAVSVERNGNGAAGDVLASAGNAFNTLVVDSASLGLVPEGAADQDEVDALDVEGDAGSFTIPRTPPTHSFDLPFGFFTEAAGMASGAIARFDGTTAAGNISFVDRNFAPSGAKDGLGVLDVAVSPDFQNIAWCSTGGLVFTGFRASYMTLTLEMSPCLQIVSGGGRLWSGIQGFGSVSGYQWADPFAGAVSFGLAGMPQGLAYRDGVLYVVVEGSVSGTLDAWDVTTTTPSFLWSVPVGGGARFVGLDDVGLLALVSNSTDDTLTLVDLGTHAVLDTIPAGDQPFGIGAVGEVALVANYTGDTLDIVDMLTGDIIDTIAVAGCSPGFTKRIAGTTLVGVACFTSGDLIFTDLTEYL